LSKASVRRRCKLGGAPYGPRNLWPEPRAPADGWNADVKDELEAVLARQLIGGIVGG
jgi:hypothetical protein